MRKILSGFLATAMVASVCATASFAATAKAENATITFDFPDAPTAGDTEKTYDRVQLVGVLENGGAYESLGVVDLADELVGTAATATDPADPITDSSWSHALAGVKFDDVKIGGKFYQITLGRNGSNQVIAKLSPAVAVTDSEYSNFKLQLLTANEGVGLDVTGDFVNGKGGETADIEQGGQFDVDNVQASDVLVCYGDGTPIPLTESGVGVDKNQNSEGGVQSNNTVYFMIRDDVIPRLSDDSYWKLKITKGDNGKYIKAISDVSKKFSKDLYDVNTGKSVDGTGSNVRHRYIKVEMNEIFTDDEIKITLDMRLAAKSKAVNAFDNVTDDTDIKVKDFTFYMKNIVKDADNDWKVGINGLMLNPVKNDWNEVTYYDEDGDVAFMKFFGDSDTGKFYSKLSTKWEHADYASYFNDQDAYIFQFTGSPSLSSTSRADLEIYSPFVDEDGNETFDPEQAVIYQVVDGDLFDITDSFEYREGNNGDMAYCTRTRFLGTYIICQKPVEEAAGDDNVVDIVPDDVTPGTNTGAPVEVNPGNNNNGGSGSKAPANTGKF